jgi:hypothetical protein
MHRHKKTIQALIAIQGSCEIFIADNSLSSQEKKYVLTSPAEALIVFPEDFHWMDSFNNNCILLVLASEYYDKNDYIYEN